MACALLNFPFFAEEHRLAPYPMILKLYVSLRSQIYSNVFKLKNDSCVRLSLYHQVNLIHLIENLYRRVPQRPAIRIHPAPFPK